MTMAHRISRAMSGDELGIRTGRHGPVVLRSAFQLQFRPEGETLRAVMVQGTVRPFLEGEALDAAAWLAALDENDRDFVECLGAALHLANHAHVGLNDLDHMIVVRDGSGMCFAEVLAPLMHDVGVDPSRLIGTIRDPSRFTEMQLAAFALRFRSLSGRIAVGMGGQHSLQTVRAVSPEFIVIDGPWFRRVACNAMAMRLLQGLLAVFRSSGARVLIEGIETPGQLVAALNVEADLVCGPLLHSPGPVGRDTPAEILPLADVLAAGASQVIPIFAGGRGKHQPG